MEGSVSLSVIESKIDRFLKRNLMGVYLALNTKSKVMYGEPFAKLLLGNPGKAVKLVSEYVMGSEDAAEFIVRAALSVIINDNEELNKLVNLLKEGRFEDFREELIRVVSEASA